MVAFLPLRQIVLISPSTSAQPNKYLLPSENLATEIGSQTVAEHRNVQLVADHRQLQHLFWCKKLRLVHEHAAHFFVDVLLLHVIEEIKVAVE